jgi:anthranilate/para-aminobenzoate synthase component II
MSRSYHITRKETNRLIAQGDAQAVVEYVEKSELKRTYKKYRKNVVGPGPGKPSKLSNAFTVRALRTVLKGRQTKP